MGGTIHCGLLRAIDVDMTPARRDVMQFEEPSCNWRSVSHRKDFGLRRKREGERAIAVQSDAIAFRRDLPYSGSVAVRFRSPAPWRPEQSEPLALQDLIGRHFRRHRVAKPQIIVTLALGSMRCRQVEPFIREHDVLRYAVALVIDQAEPALPKGGRLARPLADRSRRRRRRPVARRSRFRT
jgi:hypothetical protein